MDDDKNNNAVKFCAINTPLGRKANGEATENSTRATGNKTLRMNSVIFNEIRLRRNHNRTPKQTILMTMRMINIISGSIPIRLLIYEHGMFSRSNRLVTIWYVFILPVAKIVTHKGPTIEAKTASTIISVQIDAV